MNNPDVTEKLNAPAPASGSAYRRVGTDWMEYLENTENIERYDGMCDCYLCRKIREDYWLWKENKTAALNAELSNPAANNPNRNRRI